MKTLIDRRAMTLGLALGAAATVTRADAQVEFSQPGPGPWTGGGTIQRAGGKLHYVTLGHDVPGQPPAILLHKLGGWVADWRFVAPALAQNRKIIAFDLPGHGASQWDGPPPYIQTCGETAALLVGAFDEMGLSQVDLVGTSLGGCVSVPLAAFWPERVRRMALVSCALGPRRSLAEIAAAVDVKERTIFTPGGDPLPNDASVLVSHFGMVHPQPISAEGNVSRKLAGHWLQCSERGVAITDYHALLRRVAAPTLLLYADRDHAYLKFRADAEAALTNHVTKFVSQSGAFVIQDNPGPTAEILNAFLNEG